MSRCGIGLSCKEKKKTWEANHIEMDLDSLADGGKDDRERDGDPLLRLEHVVEERVARVVVRRLVPYKPPLFKEKR